MEFFDHVDDARPMKKMEARLGNGDVIEIDTKKLFPMLPPRVKEAIFQKGYICRFFAHDPMFMSQIVEKCLQVNEKEGSVSYSSSIKNKESTAGALYYHAHVYVETVIRGILNVESEVETDDTILAIFGRSERREDGSIVLIAAEDTQKYEIWIDLVDDLMQHNDAMKRNEQRF